jgi:hypothetical protein
LGLVLNALLIKDQNSEENSKTYLTMLSLTIAKLQEIIPKLMALQRGWFRHARKDFKKFASLGTRGLKPCPPFHCHGLQDVQTRFFVSFLFLLSTFWETSQSTLFHYYSNGLNCGLGFSNHLG